METATSQHEPHGPQGIQAGQRVTVYDQDVGAAPGGEAPGLIAQSECGGGVGGGSGAHGVGQSCSAGGDVGG